MSTLQEIQSKIEQNKAEKKKRLLKSAFDLFSSKHFSEVSINEIVKNAEVAKGTFYLYFKNKDDIRNHIVIEITQRLFNNAINDLSKENINTFEDKLIYIINHLIDDLYKEKNIIRLIDKDLALGLYSNELSKIVLENEFGLYEMFNKGLKEENKQVENIDITFFMIVELVAITCYRCLVQGIPCDIQQYKPHLYKAIRAIINNT